MRPAFTRTTLSGSQLRSCCMPRSFPVLETVQLWRHIGKQMRDCGDQQELDDAKEMWSNDFRLILNRDWLNDAPL
jgi:hypothetical protein